MQYLLGKYTVCSLHFPDEFQTSPQIPKSKIRTNTLMIDKKVLKDFNAATENGLLFPSYNQGPWEVGITNVDCSQAGCLNLSTVTMNISCSCKNSTLHGTSRVQTLFRYQPHPQVMSTFIRTKDYIGQLQRRRAVPLLVNFNPLSGHRLFAPESHGERRILLFSSLVDPRALPVSTIFINKPTINNCDP